MTLRATVGALLVELVCSKVHGCGFLGAGCTRNIGGGCCLFVLVYDLVG